MFLYTLTASTVLGYRALADEPEHIPYLDDKQPRVFKSGTPQADEPEVIHRGKQARSTYIYDGEPELDKQPRFVFIDKQPRWVFIDKQPRLTIGDTTQAEESPDYIKQPRAYIILPEESPDVNKQPRIRFVPDGSPDDESYPVYRRLLGSPSESYDEADDGIFDARTALDDDDSERRRQGYNDWLMKNGRSIKPWLYWEKRDARSVDANDVVYGNEQRRLTMGSLPNDGYLWDPLATGKDARSVDANGIPYLWDPLATGKDARSVDAQRLTRAKGGAKDARSALQERAARAFSPVRVPITIEGSDGVKDARSAPANDMIIFNDGEKDARSAPATGSAPSKDARTIFVDVTGEPNAQRLGRGMNDFQRGREARSRCPCTIDRRLDEDADHLTAPTTHPDY